MERLKEALHIALNNLLSNAIRSFLSVMGVVIGIAAVITILSIGAGAKSQIMEQISAMGVNVYFVHAKYDETTQRMGEFELQDIDRLQNLPFVLTALPQLNLYKTIRSRQAESRGIITGIDPSYLVAKGLTIIRGRNLSPIEMENRSLVCLISEGTSDLLFPEEENVVGQTVFIEGSPWQVVGIYIEGERRTKKKKKDAFGENVEILAPIHTLIRNSKDLSIQSIEVHVKPTANGSAKDELLKSMEREDPKRKGLYMIRDQKEFYTRTLEIQKLLSLIGTLVAAVSLIVGGIGMMNVMLTSVAERTREIGLRRAVGARKKDILFQFLVESCVLSSSGGIIGLLLGAALARGLPLMFKEFFTAAPRIQPSFLMLAVGAGMILGVTFGFYPAIKASKLSPAEALRSE